MTRIGLHLLIPVGEKNEARDHIVVVTGGVFFGAKGLPPQMGFHMGAGVVGSAVPIPSRCLVRALRRAQTYTYPHAAALAHLV